MTPSVPVPANESAPEFCLPDQFGAQISLESFRGHRVLLVFYPFSFSGICTRELDELRDESTLFVEAQVLVVGVSCDAMFTQRAFAEARGYDFALLSDFWPHGEVASAYGVFNERSGRPERGSFLLDEDGVVRWSLVTAVGEARPISAYREAIVR